MNPSDWSGKRVAVIGDICLDVTLTGTISRHAPESTTCPVVDVIRREISPGMAARVAAAVVRHGGKAMLIGVIGDDYHGRQLRDILRVSKVLTDGLLWDMQPTTVKQRTYVGKDLILRQDFGTNAPLHPEDEIRFAEMLGAMLPKVDAVVISDYGKSVCTPALCKAVIRLARERNLPAVVDPHGEGWSKYHGCTVIKPNIAALEAALPPCNDTRFPNILLTQGKDGMTLRRLYLHGNDMGTTLKHIPARECLDFAVIGAGDRVAAILALALAAGASVEEAAQTAAALV